MPIPSASLSTTEASSGEGEPGLAVLLVQGGRHDCDYHPQRLCPCASQAPRLCDHCPELTLHADEA